MSKKGHGTEVCQGLRVILLEKVVCEKRTLNLLSLHPAEPWLTKTWFGHLLLFHKRKIRKYTFKHNLLSQQKAPYLPHNYLPNPRRFQGQWLSSLHSDTLTSVNMLTLKTRPSHFWQMLIWLLSADLYWGLAFVFTTILRWWLPPWSHKSALISLIDLGFETEQITEVYYGKLLTYSPKHMSRQRQEFMFFIS